MRSKPEMDLIKTLALFQQDMPKPEFVSRYLEPLLLHAGLGVTACRLTEDARAVRILYTSGDSVAVNVAGCNLWGILTDVIHALEQAENA